MSDPATPPDSTDAEPPRQDASHDRTTGQSTGIPWSKFGLVAAVVVAIVVGVKFLPLDQWTAATQQWVEGLGWWGPIAFSAIYVIASLCFIPASALTIVAGVVFGLWGGFLVVSIASTITAALALLIARYVARDKVERVAASNPKFAAIDRAISSGGWKIVAMLRLSPAVPFNLLNYLFGLTSISFVKCVLTSWIAMMPGTLLYVYFGYIGKTAAEGGGKSPLEWVALAVGIVATIAVTVYLTKLAKRELAKETEITAEA